MTWRRRLASRAPVLLPFNFPEDGTMLLAKTPLAIMATLAIWTGAHAAEPAACATVRMADPGWTDITSTNGVAGTLLKALGYKQAVSTLSVPIVFQALSSGQLDVFLGNWMPAQTNFINPLLKDNKLVVVRPNLQHAKFTLAVPDYVAEAGVHSVADLAGHADQFGKRIYGIEAGAPANQNIQRMLTAGDDGLKGWKLIESSEQGMLGEVERAQRSKQWIAFLAWEPHPMNDRFHITYLEGAEQYFGPDFGSTTINTLARNGYAEQCPNADRLFRQLNFSVPMENALMVSIANQRIDGPAAARTWLKANPAQLDAWLDGVTTFDGKDGPAAVRTALGL